MLEHARFLLVVVALGCGCGTDTPDPTVTPACELVPYVDPGGAEVLTATHCTAPGGMKVYATAQEAIDAAPSGATVFLDEGQWTEKLTVSKDLTLVGRGLELTMISPPEGEAGIVVEGGVTVTIRDLAVAHATKAGIGAEGGELTLERVQVGSTNAAAEEDGHGIQVTGGAKLTLGEGTVVAGNAGVGVLVFESAAVVGDVWVWQNKRGGIAVVDGTFQPKGTQSVVDGTFEPRIDGAKIEGNVRFGIGLYGTTLAVRNTTVSGTKAAPQWNGGGDGVLVVPGTGPAGVEIGPGTVVRDSARVGMLLSGEAVAVVDGTFMGNGRGGVWVQGEGAQATLRESAVVSKNRFFGASATTGAALVVTGATIEETIAGVWTPGDEDPVGDGVSVTEGAALTMTGARLLGNDRAGVMAKAPSGTTFVVDGTFFEGGDWAVVVDDAPDGHAWDLPALEEGTEAPEAGNAWSGVDKAPLAEDLGLAVPTSLCTGATTAGATDCLPSI